MRLAPLVSRMCVARVPCRSTRVLVIPVATSLCLLDRQWWVPAAKHSWLVAPCTLHRRMPLCLARFLSPLALVGCPPQLALPALVLRAR